MWTPTTRQQHIRETSRYQTDLTDEEWRVIGPYLPAAKSTGRPRVWPMREIINGIFYVMRSGCPWRLLPSDLPPWNTIYRWFATFRNEGRFEKINHALVMLDRERVGRQCSPTGAIIDSQSVKTTEAGGPRGYDAGKKINGRKRHALVDTDGRGLVLEPHPASIQDRDGGGPILRASRRFPLILAAAVGPDWSMARYGSGVIPPGHVIEPMLTGQSIGLSPVAVVTSQRFGPGCGGRLVVIKRRRVALTHI